MKIINYLSDREETKSIERNQAVIELNQDEQNLFSYILKNIPAGNKPIPEIKIMLEMFCLNCGCTEKHACEGGCDWAQPFKCTKCYNEDGVRTK